MVYPEIENERKGEREKSGRADQQSVRWKWAVLALPSAAVYCSDTFVSWAANSPVMSLSFLRAAAYSRVASSSFWLAAVRAIRAWDSLANMGRSSEKNGLKTVEEKKT